MGFGFHAFVVTHELCHVRTVTALLGHNHATVGRVFAQLTAGLRGGKELLRHLKGDLIRRDGFGQVGALVLRLAVCGGTHHTLNVGAVAANTHDHVAALAVLEQLQRVRLPGVNGLQVCVNHVLQTAAARNGIRHGVARISVTEVEAGEPLRTVLIAVRNLIQLIFHGGGEVIIHQRIKVVLQQANHGKRNPRRHKCVAAGSYVATILDGLDNAGVGGRAADAKLLHLLHQGGFGVARRRVRGVLISGDAVDVQRVTLRYLRQVRLLVLVRVGAQPAREGDRAAGSGKLSDLAGIRLTGHRDLRGVAARVRHLGGNGALPDQLIELELFGIQGARQLTRRCKTLTSWANRLVRLLGVLHLALIDPRGIRHKVRTVELTRRSTRRIQALLGQRRRVCTHIGNVAVFVQTLRNAHRARGRKVQLAASLLLQRRRHKRRIRLTRVRLLLHAGHPHGVAERTSQALGFLLIDDHRLPLQPPPIVEVASLGDTCAVDSNELRIEVRVTALRGKRGREIPILRGNERHALTFTLHNHTRSHRLHTASRQARHNLLPQNRADLIAIQTVQDAARFLRIHQIHIQLASVFGGLTNRGLSNLVEHHALNRHLRLQRLQQVPGNRLTLTVRVCCQKKLVRLLELGL